MKTTIIGHGAWSADRKLTRTFGQGQDRNNMPSARIAGKDGKTSKWKSKALR
jgi:hypothetical protein